MRHVLFGDGGRQSAPRPSLWHNRPVRGETVYPNGKKQRGIPSDEANPRIEICALPGESWLRIAADAVEDDDREARVHMLDAYPSLKALYAPDDGNTQVLYLKNVEATFSSFTAAPETYRF